MNHVLLIGVYKAPGINEPTSFEVETFLTVLENEANRSPGLVVGFVALKKLRSADVADLPEEGPVFTGNVKRLGGIQPDSVQNRFPVTAVSISETVEGVKLVQIKVVHSELSVVVQSSIGTGSWHAEK